MMMNVCDDQQSLHEIITKLWEKSLKTYFISQRDYENFEQNNKSIAINVLFSPQDSEEITLV